MKHLAALALASALAACAAEGRPPGDDWSGPGPALCAAVGATWCADHCWPPGIDCDTAGRCPLDDQCWACLGGSTPWCDLGRFVCCPPDRPHLCGAGQCVADPDECLTPPVGVPQEC